MHPFEFGKTSPNPQLEEALKNESSAQSGFVPEPWMIRAFFEAPKLLRKGGIFKEVESYIEARPIISRAWQTANERTRAQDELIRNFAS